VESGRDVVLDRAVPGSRRIADRFPPYLRPLVSPLYGVGLLVILLCAILPFFVGTEFFALSLVFCTIYIMLALAWDLSSGLTGYLNLGLPFFFGLGAVWTGFSFYHGVHSVPLLLTIDFLIGGGAGLLFALPTVRLRGPFFTLLSLLLPLIAVDFIVSFWIVLHLRTEGYYGLPFLAPTYLQELPWLSLTTAVVLTACVYLSRSRFGLVLRGIRDDEEAVESKGIPTFPYKVAVFALASAIAAFSGGTYATTTSSGTVDSFDFNFLLYPILIAIVGGAIYSNLNWILGVRDFRRGVGTVVGSVFAGYGIILFSQFLNLPALNLEELTLPIFSFVAIALVLLIPGSLAPRAGGESSG
jgi:branched-chain amino acid transport system permease protein